MGGVSRLQPFPRALSSLPTDLFSNDAAVQVDDESGRVLSLFSQVEETVALMDEAMWRIEAMSARLETVDAPESEAPQGLHAFLSEASAAITAVEVHIIVIYCYYYFFSSCGVGNG